MSKPIDYRTVGIPREATPAEYSYPARRAAILEKMRDAGHPRLLNQYDLADEFGVNQSTISRDLSRIAESISEYPSTHRDLETKTVIERCIVGLLEDEEWRAAARTQLDFNEWLNEHEKLAELEERLDALDTSCGLGSDYRIK